MPETLSFVEECGRRWGVHIVWIEFDREDGFRVVGPGTNRPASTNRSPNCALGRDTCPTASPVSVPRN
jgi:hypothetical protein